MATAMRVAGNKEGKGGKVNGKGNKGCRQATAGDDKVGDGNNN